MNIKRIKDLFLDQHTLELIHHALPIILSLALQLVYSVIDLYWVGKIGHDAVAAVGSAVFFVNLSMSFCSIVSIGAMIQIAQTIGSKNVIKQKQYTLASARLSLLISTLMGILLLIFARRMITFFAITDSRVEEMAINYLHVLAVGMPFCSFNMLQTSMLNAIGDTKVSLRGAIYGNTFNLLLSPLFIFIAGWGVVGVAVATLISWIISSSYLYRALRRRGIQLFQKEIIGGDIYSKLIRVGGAGATQRILFTLIAIVIGRIVATFGVEAIAAQKIALQIEAISFMVLGGLSQSLSIKVGKSYGAKLYEEIRIYYYSALKMGAIIAIITTAIFLGTPESLITIFVDDPKTIDIAAYYLAIIGLSQVFMGLEMLTGGGFNGQGLTHYSASISIVFTLLRIPMALYLSSTSLGIQGVWWSIAISSMLKGIISAILFQFRQRKLEQQI